MGLLSSLLRDRLTRLAHGSDRGAFLAAFLDTDIAVLSLPSGLALDPATMTQEELLAMTEAGVRDLSERGEFEPFMYVDHGSQVLPIFSSQRHVRIFIEQYVQRINKVVPFQVLTLEGRHVILAMQAADRVVLNDGSKNEVETTPEDIAKLSGS